MQQDVWGEDLGRIRGKEHGREPPDVRTFRFGVDPERYHASHRGDGNLEPINLVPISSPLQLSVKDDSSVATGTLLTINVVYRGRI